MKQNTLTQTFQLRLLGMGLATTFLAPQLSQAREDIEWEPGEGYHEEEWYDPSDWFNDDGQVDYEYDGFDYYDGAWDGYTWYDDYDYVYDFDTDPEYVWDADTNSWELQDETGYEYSAKYEFDDSGSNQSNQQQSSQNQSMQSGQNQSGQTLKGKIEAFRKIDVTSSAGFQETHALAKVSLENGQTAVVDLGMAALLTSDLSSGDDVTFHGSTGKIDGKNVFVASKLTANGETAYIDRTLPAKSSSSSGSNENQMSSSSNNQSQQRQMSANSSRQNQRNQQEQLVLEGKIAEKEVVELEGSSDPQTVVKIELQNGKSASVNLGPETSLSDLDLQKGDQISVRGHTEQISGKNIVVAQSIRVEGEKVKG